MMLQPERTSTDRTRRRQARPRSRFPSLLVVKRALCLCLVLSPAAAFAQTTDTDSPPRSQSEGSPVEPATTASPSRQPAPAASEPSAAADTAQASWRERYARAKDMLLEGRAAEAAAEFTRLAQSATTYDERLLAEELAELANAQATDQRLEPPRPDIRTTDELSILYTTAFVYGFGTSGWLALQLKPNNAAAAILPFIGITTATVGGVALADDYRPFRYGVPHSIAAGMFLGLGEGMWIVSYQHARASALDEETDWSSATVATVLWSGATIGAIGGGVYGALTAPTPGEVSFATTTTLWAGLLSSFMGYSLQGNDDRRDEAAFLIGGAGYNVGLLSGMLFAPVVSPSVTRVRFVDLSGIAGGLLSVGGYLLTAADDATSRGGLASAAVGSALGVGIGWWLTSDMDTPPAHDAAPLLGLVPNLTPVPGGAIAGVSGAL